MKKLITNLSYFKYNTTINTTGFKVTWYVVEEDEGEEFGRGFKPDELDEFFRFINNHPLNFEGDKNAHIVDDEEILYFDIFSFIDDSKLRNRPNNLFLKRDPQLTYGNILESMDIILTTPNGSEIEYNLKFDVVGVFN